MAQLPRDQRRLHMDSHWVPRCETGLSRTKQGEVGKGDEEGKEGRKKKKKKKKGEPQTIFTTSGYRASVITPRFEVTYSTSSFRVCLFTSFPLRSERTSLKSKRTQHCWSFLMNRSGLADASISERGGGGRKERQGQHRSGRLGEGGGPNQ